MQTPENPRIKPLFKTRQIVITPGAIGAFFEKPDTPFTYLKRHFSGDWGNLDPQDVLSNIEAVHNDLRVMSVYDTKDGTRIWIITEADRSVTTILLPEEY